MNRPLSTKLSQTITRYKLAIVIVYTIMLAISLLVITGRLMSDQAMVDNSISVWFQKNDAELAEFHDFQQTFGSEEWSSVIIKTKNIYEKAFLNELRIVTEEIEALDVVVRATSIANVRVNRMIDDEELWFAPILEGDKSEQWQQPDTLKAYKARLNNNEFVNNLLHHTGDDQHTLIVIQSEDRSDEPGAYRRDYYDAIYALLENRKTFLAVGFQGNSPLIVELNKSSMRDVYIFYTTSVLLLFILGLLVFRNLKDALILLAMALGVLVPAMACIAAADIPYNMMTQIMPVLLIAIATANVVHLIKEFHRNRLRMSNEEAIQTAISMLWVAGGWAAATTLVGFASFIISEVRPVSQLGLFGSIGILLGWVLSLTAAPAFILYLYEGLPPLSTDAASNSETYMERVPGFIARHKKKIFTLFALLSVTLIGIVNLQVGSNFAKFIGATTATRSSFDF
ncbi:MAG: MMPL family transporter, partial [Gammaproteobacteria bacterium]|nr:MMPL family transporter [Gammaproteobacteria bacterium]